MDETEVTNLCLEYLDWLKAFSTEEDNYKHIYEGASPDTWWRNRLGYNETMTNNYLRHPSLLSCSRCKLDSTVEFSKWRTDRVTRPY
jgi:hypothetical protein